MKTFIAVGALFLLCGNALSEEPSFDELKEKVNLAYSEANYTLIECAVFFRFSAMGSEARPEPQYKAMAEGLIEQAEIALQYAFVLAEGAELSEAGMLARVELVMGEQKEMIDDNMVNFAVLMNKYLKPCESIMKDPLQVLHQKLIDQNLDPKQLGL